MKMIKMIKMNGSFVEGFGAATADADVCGTYQAAANICEYDDTKDSDDAGTVIDSNYYRTFSAPLPTSPDINYSVLKLTLPSDADKTTYIRFTSPLSTFDNQEITIDNINVSTNANQGTPTVWKIDTTAAQRGLYNTEKNNYQLRIKNNMLDLVIKYDVDPDTSNFTIEAKEIIPFASEIIFELGELFALTGDQDRTAFSYTGANLSFSNNTTMTNSTCEQINTLFNDDSLGFITEASTSDCASSWACLKTTPRPSCTNSPGCSTISDAADGGGNCLCGDGIGDGGEMKFYEEGSSWPYSYPTDPNSADGTQITGLTLEDTESCLKSAIDQSKISATNNAATNNADLCHPRWPCISSMSDYLEILNTPLIAPAGNPTADVCNKTVTGDDLDNQNKIPISLCVPYDNADGNDSDCYGLHTIGECESVQNDDDDSTNKKCVWNPYCQMPNNGRDNLGNETSEGTRDAGGSETSDGTRTSKVYTDMLTCIKSGNIWDLPMMEELNDKRDDDNKIIFPDGIEHYTNTTEFGYDAIKSAMRGNGLGCHVEGNGGALMCAVSSSAYNSADRLYGQCPGNLEHSPCIQDEEITDSGDQGSCTYCRTTNTNSTVVDSTVKTIQDVDPTGATTFLTDTFGITPSGDITDCVNIYHI